MGEALLAPTRLYARHVQALLGAGVDVRAMSHITGGGLPGNVPRVLPDGLGLRIERAWARAAASSISCSAARGIEEPEMRRAFNAGVGFVVVVAAEDEARASDGAAGPRRGAHRARRRS